MCQLSLFFVQYISQWLINFNPLKTEAILFTLKLLEQLAHIIFDGTAIKFVSEHKHLDHTLSNNGQWHSHIDNIIDSIISSASASKSWAYCANLNSLSAGLLLTKYFLSLTS